MYLITHTLCPRASPRPPPPSRILPLGEPVRLAGRFWERLGAEEQDLPWRGSRKNKPHSGKEIKVLAWSDKTSLSTLRPTTDDGVYGFLGGTRAAGEQSGSDPAELTLALDVEPAVADRTSLRRGPGGGGIRWVLNSGPSVGLSTCSAFPALGNRRWASISSTRPRLAL